MSSTSHVNSRQVEFSGDFWTDKFIHEHQLAAEVSAAEAEKSKKEETKRVVSCERLLELLDPQ